MKATIAIIAITLAAMIAGCVNTKPQAYKCPDGVDARDCECLKAGARELAEMRRISRSSARNSRILSTDKKTISPTRETWSRKDK